MTDKEIMRTLRKYSEAQDMNQHDIAKKLGGKSAQVNMWFNGKRGINLYNLTRLADAVGLDVVLIKKEARKK